MIEYKKEIEQLMLSIIKKADKWDAESLVCARGLCLTLTDFYFKFFFGKILSLA